MSAQIKAQTQANYGTANTITEMKRNIEIRREASGTSLDTKQMEAFEYCVHDFLRNRIAVLFGKMDQGVSNDQIQKEILRTLK